jgi:GGDEF domain-containing protein
MRSPGDARGRGVLLRSRAPARGPQLPPRVRIGPVAVVEREPYGHGEAGNPFWAHAAWLEMIAALDWLPLASLVLTFDGSAVGANQAWAALSAAPAETARGDGWLRVVEPLDREPLRARLREAAAVGESGCADFRLAGVAGERWSRWWWRPGPARRLIVCVTDLDERPPRDDDRWRDDHGPPVRLMRRSEFVNLVGRALRRSRGNGASVAVIAVSLDGTAASPGVNGQPDHDVLLRNVAERILGAAQTAKAAALVGRDEFAVLCDDLHAPADAGIAARRIREAMEQPLDIAGTAVSIAAATGFLLASSPSETAEALVARARLAARPVSPDQPARAVGTDPGLDLAEMAVHRLFGVGRTVQAAADLVHGPAAERVQQAVDELDAIIRDIRTAAFERRHPGHP